MIGRLLAWLRRLFGIGDVYVVRDVYIEHGEPIIGISASLQGAQLIKANYVQARAEINYPATGSRGRALRMMAEQVMITNFDVQDI